jgi:hypothetical protein
MADTVNLEDEEKLTQRLVRAVAQLSLARKKMLDERLNEWHCLKGRCLSPFFTPCQSCVCGEATAN